MSSPRPASAERPLPPIQQRPVREQATPLLELRDLRTHFPIHRGFLGRQAGAVRAVDGVDLAIQPGTTLGLVGECGCGKTTLGRTVMRLDATDQRAASCSTGATSPARPVTSSAPCGGGCR